jgi:2-polyprenyl-3-methyl-5-hydroxy-6-metoxy-1,4-benzoquinol methylase
VTSDLDRIAQDYHLKGDMPDMFIERICQEVELDWIETLIDSTMHVIELGYGDGITFARLSGLSKYTLVEGSGLLIDVASRVTAASSADVQLCQALFEEYSPGEPADLVVASHVLEHVDDPQSLLLHLATWLRPGGKILIIVPNAESIHRRLGVILGLQQQLDDLSGRDLLVGHQRVYNLERLTSDVSSAGLSVLATKGFFIKVLSNAQMLNLDPDVVRGLCKVGEECPPEMCANLAVLIGHEN